MILIFSSAKFGRKVDYTKGTMMRGRTLDFSLISAPSIQPGLKIVRKIFRGRKREGREK